jgi:Tfp pilus assembly protein PilV
MSEQKNEAGFTLVEIMVAMAFFSLVIIGVAQAIITGQQHSRAVEENALILARCEDIMRQMEEMSITDIANENGTSFNIGGVPGSGTVSVTNPYLGSDDIAHVVLTWDGIVILERAFGEAAAIPLNQ